MLKEIAQEARNRIANQGGLWKSGVKGTARYTCIALALSDACDGEGPGRDYARDQICRAFLKANNLPQNHSKPFECVAEFNDDPQTTHAGAVAALDNLVNYLATQEGE